MTQGTVQRLWRWPVKSMGGEEVRALSLDARGVGGDRTHAVLHEHKGEWRPLTAREAPRMLAWRASYPFNLDAGLDPAQPPYAIVEQPDGTRFQWGDPMLRTAIEADVGKPVRFRRDVAGMPDVPGQILLTTQASVDALAEELGTAIDLRRFRPNLHLELEAPAWAEEQWTGGVVEIEGGVRLVVVEPCERCAIPTRDPDTQEKWPELLRHLAKQHGQNLGVLARVIEGGRVAAGAQVRVQTA